VLKGLGLVLRQITLQNKSKYADRFDQAFFHFSEFVCTVRDAYPRSVTTHDTSHSTTPPHQTTTAPQATTAPQTTTATAPTITVPPTAMTMTKTPPTRLKPKDTLGFSLINDDDNNDDINKANATKEHADTMLRTPGGSVMREKAVPGTQIERFFGFGSLAVRMVVGSAVDGLANSISGQPQSKSISDANAERFAESLCRMRGNKELLPPSQFLRVKFDI
jgi:hypothetical protein